MQIGTGSGLEKTPKNGSFLATQKRSNEVSMDFFVLVYYLACKLTNFVEKMDEQQRS